MAAIRANPTLAAITAEGFLTRLGFGMVSFALPLFALSLGMGLAEIGLLATLRTVTTIAVKPLMGWAADRFGRKRTLVIAVILRCVVGLLFAFAYLPWHLYALRILHGIMTAARDPSASALIAERGNKKSMASSFAWYTTARDVGASLGYGIAGLLIQLTGDYRIVFLIAFFTSLVALVTVLRYVAESSEVGVKEERPAQAPRSPAHKTSSPMFAGLLRYATFGLMVAGSAEMITAFFPIIATQYAHLTEGEAGLVVSMSTLAVLVAGPSFGWLSDHAGRNAVLGIRSFANIFSSLAYIFFPSFGGLALARVMDDTGKAAFRPTWGAILAEVSDVEPAKRARRITFVDSAYTTGTALAPMIAGFLMASFGLPVMLGARVALAVLTEIYATQVFKHKKVVATAMASAE